MSYDMIDRFLRNNLGDDDYAEYSAALDSLCAPPQQHTWVGLTDEELQKILQEVSGQGWKPMLEAIEAKLKEKNT